jgi:hypothetical protein
MSVMKNCPFCKCDAIEILENSDLCWVHCMQCDADGPPDSSIDLCIDLWNTALRPLEVINDNLKRS